MFKPSDIVAVYGESPTDKTLNDNHPGTQENLITSEALSSIVAAAARYHICEVRRVLNAAHGNVLVVNKISKPDDLFLIHDRQARLVERDGVKIEAKKAQYIATVYNEHSERSDYGSFESVNEALNFIRNERDDIELDDEDQNPEDYLTWQVYKGIKITDEVSL